jgi:putative PIN family toxin of toxin-antitoxin system
MTPEDRFVFDTNVLVSALAFPGSTPRKAFDLAIAQRPILASEQTSELHRALRRPRLARYFTRSEQDAFLARLVGQITLVEVIERLSICRDPNDDRFLELTATGGASHLITGDRDLLALDPFRGTRIMRPAAWLREVVRRA